MTIDNLISWLQEAEDNNIWLVSTQSVKRHLERIKETEQLNIHSVSSSNCKGDYLTLTGECKKYCGECSGKHCDYYR